MPRPPSADEPGDQSHEEYLAEEHLEAGEHLSRLLAGHEVAVAGGRQGREAEEDEVSRLVAPAAVARYQKRISGPLLDRIDIHVEVPTVPYRELTGRTSGTTSATMREQVVRARAVQHKRFADGTNNASMDSRQLKAHCELSDACLLLMKQAMDELGLSARAYDKVRRVARTIADIEVDFVVRGVIAALRALT